MLNRIQFFVLLSLCAFQLKAQPVISFTIDDGVTKDMPGYPFEEWNKMILDNLDKEGVKAIFFVTGANKTDERGQFLLSSWDEKGHRISNHTVNHLNYNSDAVTYEQFKQEFLRNDSIIRKHKNYLPLFRFPYLKEGNTKPKVDSFRHLMKKHNYRNGHVTIDASDWYINARLVNRLKENPSADTENFKKYYLAHLYERASYYESLAFKITGRHISHTLLLHHNLTSALFLDDLIQMFRDKGWKVVSAEKAYCDAVFKKEPTNIPAGESLIWALAKESGKFEDVLRYPAEDGKYEKDKMDSLGL